MKVYFLEVTTYSNTNKLGKAMAEFAVQNYQHRLTTEDGWLKMVDELKSAYWSLKGHYPRVRKDFEIIDNLAQRMANPKATPYSHATSMVIAFIRHSSSPLLLSNISTTLFSAI